MIVKTSKIRLMPRDEQIAIAIAQAGVPQVQIARDLGINNKTLNQVINGHKVSVSIAHKLADYFNCDIKGLFFAVDLRNPPIDDQVRSHAA